MSDAPLSVTEATCREEWDAFVDGHPEAAVYHRWEWRAIIARAFGHQTRYLVARTGGVMAGVLPLVAMRSPVFGRFVVSLPFVNYGGVLASAARTADALLGAAGALARAGGYRHVELRHRARRFSSLPFRAHKVAMELALPSTRDALFGLFDRKLRNQIRKSEKSGLDVAAGGRELLDAFYEIFATNMRDLGTPVYGRNLFEEVLQEVGPRAAVIVVSRGGEPLAAGITITYRDRVEMPWASALRRGREWCANQMLYWAAIGRAVDAHARQFDFGRSTIGDSHFEFKKQWGAVPDALHWEYLQVGGAALPDFSPASAKYRRAVAIWKRLPLPVTRLVGPHIVRCIP